MYKIIFTVRKRQDLTRDQFIQYYEERHVPLVRRMVPRAPLYRRNFIIDNSGIGGISGVNTEAAGFDCLTELGFETRAEAEAHIATYLDPAIHPVIVADEVNFIEPGGLRFYIVEARWSVGDRNSISLSLSGATDYQA